VPGSSWILNSLPAGIVGSEPLNTAETGDPDQVPLVFANGGKAGLEASAEVDSVVDDEGKPRRCESNLIRNCFGGG
jgi:hypothetical protein